MNKIDTDDQIKNKRRKTEYDRNIPNCHSYLSSELVTIPSNISYDISQILDLPILPLYGAILFPGQVLPFRIFQYDNIGIGVEQLLCGELAIGVVSNNQLVDKKNDRTIDSFAIYGVTAEIYSIQIVYQGLVGLLIGRQKFKVLTISKKEDTILTFAKIKILQAYDDAIPLPINGTLIKRIKAKVLHWFKDSYDTCMMIKDHEALSWKISSQLPVPNLWRLNLFSMDNIASRFCFILRYITNYNALCCQQCNIIITTYKDLISMSSVGLLSIYVDSHGHHYETITTSMVQNVCWSTRESSHLSWFPGYSWSCGICSSCGNLIGWRYCSLDSNSSPESFFCLILSSLDCCKDTD